MAPRHQGSSNQREAIHSNSSTANNSIVIVLQADLLPLTWEARELARLLARPYFFEVVVRKNPHAMTYVFQGDLTHTYIHTEHIHTAHLRHSSIHGWMRTQSAWYSLC